MIMMGNGSIQSNNKKYFILLSILFGLAFSIFPVQDAFAEPKVFWNAGSYNMNQGGVEGKFYDYTPITLQVIDHSVSGSGSIKVKITSSVDPKGIDLTLIEDIGDLGTFRNSNLTLMADHGNANINSQVTISIYDNRNGTPTSDIQILEDLPYIVTDSYKKLDFFPTFTETGNNTNVYKATIKFGPVTNPAKNIIAASPGDAFVVDDGVGGNRVMGFIAPNPNGEKGAIRAEVDGNVTATYQGVSDFFIVDEYLGPGRGTGGLIRPGLVVDSSSGGDSSGSGDCSNCLPPTLGVDSNFNRIVENGFSFNDNSVNVEQFYTPYPLIESKIGEENTIKLKIFDDGGSQNIIHVALAYGLGKGQSFSESKAIINLDRTLFGTEKITWYDPENVLDDVRVVTSRDLCNSFSKIQCLVVEIHHTFRDTLEFNIVSTNVWDEKKNSWTNFYNHGIEVVGDSLNPPKTKSVAFGEKDKRGLFELTEIDKRKHLWIDEFGDIYEYKGNDFFVKVFTHPTQPKLDKVTSHGCDRNCNWFNEYKHQQESHAQSVLMEMMDGKSIKNESMDEPFSHHYQITNRAEDFELQQSIILEQQRATETFQKLFPERFSHDTKS